MDATLALITPEAEAIAHEAETTLGVIQAVRITTAEECQAAVDQTREIKAKAARLEETRKAMTRPLDDAKKAIMDFFRGPADLLAKAETLLKGSITTFQQEQARIAAAAAAEARRQEEADRARQAEEQAAAEALLQQAEAAALAGDTATAEALEEKAMAAQAQSAPINTYVAPAMEKPKGAAMRKVWKARVIDPALVPDQFKVINEKALDAYAKSMKQDAKVPGVEFYAEDSLAIR
jgi:colicin import membrane protein